MAAVICAVIGVGTMVWNLGQLPWVSVSLAVSFAFIWLDQEMFIGNDNDEYYAGNTAYNAAGFGL